MDIPEGQIRSAAEQAGVKIVCMDDRGTVIEIGRLEDLFRLVSAVRGVTLWPTDQLAAGLVIEDGDRQTYCFPSVQSISRRAEI